MSGLEVNPDPHTSFSIRSEIESLHAVEETLTRIHPDWTREHVKGERSRIYRSGMFQAQKDSFLAEKRGDETMQSVEASWRVVDGDLVHDNYSFGSMIVHAKSKEERISLTAWRDAVVTAEAGAKIVGLDYHVSKEGTFSIRFADVWEKGEDGVVRQDKRVDLTKGKDMGIHEALDFLDGFAGHDEGRILIQENQVGLVIIAPEKNTAYNLTGELLDTSRNRNGRDSIKDPTRIQEGIRYTDAAKYEDPSRGKGHAEVHDRLRFVPDNVISGSVSDAAARVAHELRITSGMVNTFLFHERQQKIPAKKPKEYKASALDRLRIYLERKKDILSGKTRKEEVLGGAGKRPVVIFTRRQGDKKNVLTDTRYAINGPDVLRRVSVVVSQTIFPSESVREPGAEPKRLFIREKEKRSMRRIRKLIRKRDVLYGSPSKHGTKEIRITMSERRRRTYSSRKESGILLPIRTERKKNKKEKRVLPQKERAVKKREEQFIGVLLHLRKKIESSVRSEKKIVSRRHYDRLLFEIQGVQAREKTTKKLKEKRNETVVRLSFAWILWLLEQRKTGFRRAESRTERGGQTKNKEKTHREIKKQEPRPWILLSIIWHLAMIREQGLQSTSQPVGQSRNTKTQTKNQMKYPVVSVQRPVYPIRRQGIIFNAGS